MYICHAIALIKKIREIRLSELGSSERLLHVEVEVPPSFHPGRWLPLTQPAPHCSAFFTLYRTSRLRTVQLWSLPPINGLIHCLPINKSSLHVTIVIYFIIIRHLRCVTKNSTKSQHLFSHFTVWRSADY
jgi:hypothetical protein